MSLRRLPLMEEQKRKSKGGRPKKIQAKLGKTIEVGQVNVYDEIYDFVRRHCDSTGWTYSTLGREAIIQWAERQMAGDKTHGEGLRRWQITVEDRLTRLEEKLIELAAEHKKQVNIQCNHQ